MRRKAFLVIRSWTSILQRIPIWVYEVNDDLFPVKFEYRQRGYKGLRFSERLNNIEFE